MTTWLAGACAALAVAAALPPRARWPTSPSDPTRARPEDLGWMQRWRWLWSLLSGLAGAMFVSGASGMVVGVATAAVTWCWIGRSEPASVRRTRQAAERDLPGVVHLLAAALESGCDVGASLQLIGDAFPGPATRFLDTVPARLGLGVPAEVAWRPVLESPELAPLGRAMLRASRSGASVTDEVDRLAGELGRRARARMEDRARTVGVKAAVPLGLCLLPSFLLIGVVPLVIGLVRSLSW